MFTHFEITLFDCSLFFSVFNRHARSLMIFYCTVCDTSEQVDNLCNGSCIKKVTKLCSRVTV